MLYFLVIIVPFAAYMAFLIRQNNQLKKSFTDILKNLKVVANELALPDTTLIDELKKTYIITGNSIKEAESYLNTLEDILDIKKQKTVSNTFKPKIQKLELLYTRTKKLSKKIQTKDETEMQPVL